MYSLPGVRVRHIHVVGEQIIIEAEPTASSGACPACQQLSRSRHSRSGRVLADLPACGRPVRVRLTVSRSYGRAPACPKRTVVEQIPLVTQPHRQRLARLEAVLATFSATVGGAAGARLLRQIGVTVSGSSLVRVLRRVELPPRPAPRVLGVDDWAWRRGSRYGAVLVDLAERRPVDLLADRTASSLEAWLKANPGPHVIVRDRSTEFARGAALGAPDARQVLDRWHLLRNVREVAERLVARASQDLTHLAEGAELHGVPRFQSAAERARRRDERERAAAVSARVQALTQAGGTILGIARELGISRVTVRKYRSAAAVPERARPHYRSQLDPYEPYLRRRWAEGCRNGLQLWRELRERGYPGGSRRVSRWAQLRRTEPAPATPPRRRPSGGVAGEPAAPVRRPSNARLAWLLISEPACLTDDERQWLARLRAASAAAAAAYPLLQAIRQIIRRQAAERLDAWLAEATSCGLPDLETFAAGLQRERAELLAALELPWSTGPVEGQITRLKLIKRQVASVNQVEINAILNEELNKLWRGESAALVAAREAAARSTATCKTTHSRQPGVGSQQPPAGRRGLAGALGSPPPRRARRRHHSRSRSAARCGGSVTESVDRPLSGSKWLAPRGSVASVSAEGFTSTWPRENRRRYRPGACGTAACSTPLVRRPAPPPGPSTRTGAAWSCPAHHPAPRPRPSTAPSAARPPAGASRKRTAGTPPCGHVRVRARPGVGALGPGDDAEARVAHVQVHPQQVVPVHVPLVGVHLDRSAGDGTVPVLPAEQQALVPAGVWIRAAALPPRRAAPGAAGPCAQ